MVGEESLVLTLTFPIFQELLSLHARSCIINTTKKSIQRKLIIGYDRRFMACEFAEQIAPFVRGCGFEPILSDSFVTTPVL